MVAIFKKIRLHFLNIPNLTHQKGMRGYVGKVCMNTNSPQWYIEPSTEQSIKDTTEFSEYVLDKNSKLLQPIITPRFAPSCTSKKILNIWVFMFIFVYFEKYHLLFRWFIAWVIRSSHPIRYTHSNTFSWKQTRNRSIKNISNQMHQIKNFEK